MIILSREVLFMFKKLSQYYQYFSNLSLDVVLGVFCCMLPLPEIFGVNMPFVWYIGLPFCTWLVYISDHFYDNSRQPSIDTERHRFISIHQNKVITVAVLLVLILLVLTIWFTPIHLILSGTFIVFLCLIYYLSLRFPIYLFTLRLLNKELSVAFIYSTSVYIAFFIGQSFALNRLLYSLIFFLLAYQNLLLMAVYEIKKDSMNHDLSTTMQIGIRNSKLIYHLCTWMIALILIVLLWRNLCNNLTLSYFIMVIANHLLMALGDRWNNPATLRKAGEMIFWIPGLIYTMACWL